MGQVWSGWAWSGHFRDEKLHYRLRIFRITLLLIFIRAMLEVVHTFKMCTSRTTLENGLQEKCEHDPFRNRNTILLLTMLYSCKIDAFPLSISSQMLYCYTYKLSLSTTNFSLSHTRTGCSSTLSLALLLPQSHKHWTIGRDIFDENVLVLE